MRTRPAEAGIVWAVRVDCALQQVDVSVFIVNRLSDHRFQRFRNLKEKTKGMQSIAARTARTLLRAPQAFSSQRRLPDSIRSCALSATFSTAMGQSEQAAYAAVDHSEAFENAMRGLHGKQLELAVVEGYGKDEPDFDPFIEEEIEEDRLARLEAEGEDRDDDMEDEEDDDSFSDEDHIEFSKIYNNDGSLRRTKSELATLRAGAPAGGLIAIIALAGSQHKVTTDDVLIVNRLKPVKKWYVGSTHTLDAEQVLLLSSSHFTLVGMPFVAGAKVTVMVEEITKDAKVIVFKKRRRKHSQRKNGFRRDVTMLRILDIQPPEPYENAKHVGRPQPAPMVEQTSAL